LTTQRSIPVIPGDLWREYLSSHRWRRRQPQKASALNFSLVGVFARFTPNIGEGVSQVEFDVVKEMGIISVPWKGQGVFPFRNSRTSYLKTVKSDVERDRAMKHLVSYELLPIRTLHSLSDETCAGKAGLVIKHSVEDLISDIPERQLELGRPALSCQVITKEMTRYQEP
jgi:hypothetical protein